MIKYFLDYYNNKRGKSLSVRLSDDDLLKFVQGMELYNIRTSSIMMKFLLYEFGRKSASPISPKLVINGYVENEELLQAIHDNDVYIKAVEYAASVKQRLEKLERIKLESEKRMITLSRTNRALTFTNSDLRSVIYGKDKAITKRDETIKELEHKISVLKSILYKEVPEPVMPEPVVIYVQPPPIYHCVTCTRIVEIEGSKCDPCIYEESIMTI